MPWWQFGFASSALSPPVLEPLWTEGTPPETSHPQPWTDQQTVWRTHGNADWWRRYDWRLTILRQYDIWVKTIMKRHEERPACIRLVGNLENWRIMSHNTTYLPRHSLQKPKRTATCQFACLPNGSLAWMCVISAWWAVGDRHRTHVRLFQQ